MAAAWPAPSNKKVPLDGPALKKIVNHVDAFDVSVYEFVNVVKALVDAFVGVRCIDLVNAFVYVLDAVVDASAGAFVDAFVDAGVTADAKGKGKGKDKGHWKGKGKGKGKDKSKAKSGE